MEKEKSVIAKMAEDCFFNNHLYQICHGPAFILGYTKGARDILDKITGAAMNGITAKQKYDNVCKVISELKIKED